MKNCLPWLFRFIVVLVVLSTGTARACSNNEGISNAMETVQMTDEHCDTAGDLCVATHPGQDCPPDTDGCGKCHCPGCGATGNATFAGFFKYTYFELRPPDWSNSESIANFFYNAPCTSAHLAALFRPPITHLV